MCADSFRPDSLALFTVNFQQETTADNQALSVPCWQEHVVHPRALWQSLLNLKDLAKIYTALQDAIWGGGQGSALQQDTAPFPAHQ